MPCLGLRLGPGGRLVEDRLEPVEPGRLLIWSPNRELVPDLFAVPVAAERSCRLAPEQIPPVRLETFPSLAEIIRRAVELRPTTGLAPDERLIRRRECEYVMFMSVEEADELPVIRAGFTSISEFVARRPESPAALQGSIGSLSLSRTARPGDLH